MNEILGWWYDHTYVRRNGTLYDEWSTFGATHRLQIAERQIPAAATLCTPPIRYTS